MNTKKLDVYYNSLLSEFPKGECQTLSERAPLRLQAMGLPNELIYIWKKYGICGYGQGLWWHTNPADYEDIVKMWLEGTEFWQPDTNPYYVIGRTAFGKLKLWGKRSGRNLTINPLLGLLLPTPSQEDKYIKTNNTQSPVCTFVGAVQKRGIDARDTNDKFLFDRALKKLGKLHYNEMYAPVPAPIFSGGMTIDNIQKVEIFTQLALLRDMIDEPEIMENPYLK